MTNKSLYTAIVCVYVNAYYEHVSMLVYLSMSSVNMSYIWK